MEMPEFLDCTTVWRMALLGLKPLMIYFSMFRVCAMMLSSITSICFVNDVDTFIFKCPCNRTWHVRVWHEGSLSISKFLVRLARGLVGGGEPLVALTFASWAFHFFRLYLCVVSISAGFTWECSAYFGFECMVSACFGSAKDLVMMPFGTVGTIGCCVLLAFFGTQSLFTDAFGIGLPVSLVVKNWSVSKT